MALLAISQDCLALGVSHKVFVYRIVSDGLPAYSDFLDLSPLSASLPLTKNVDGSEKKEQLLAHHNITVLSIAFSGNGNCLAVATSAKTVLLFSRSESSFAFLRGFRIPKSPTKIIFDPSESHVVVADRAGCVRLYSLSAGVESLPEDHEDSEEYGFEGKLMCHAISMFLDMTFSPCGRFLCVADRDQKIRIYRYPQTFLLETICLGHTEYVESLAWANDILLSSGGDGLVLGWNALTGENVVHSSRESPLSSLCSFTQDGEGRVAGLSKDKRSVYVFSLNGKELQCLTSFPVSAEPFSISASSHSVFSVSRKSLEVFSLSKREIRMVEVDEEVAELLDAAKPVLGDLTKKTAFDNLGQYHINKLAKLKKKAEKRRAGREKLHAAKRVAMKEQSPSPGAPSELP